MDFWTMDKYDKYDDHTDTDPLSFIVSEFFDQSMQIFKTIFDYLNKMYKVIKIQ
jgi:hypothetical protein